MTCDTLWHNARLATLTGPGLGVVERGAVGAKDGKIVYAAAEAGAPQAAWRSQSPALPVGPAEKWRLTGRLRVLQILPGIFDSSCRPPKAGLNYKIANYAWGSADFRLAESLRLFWSKPADLRSVCPRYPSVAAGSSRHTFFCVPFPINNQVFVIRPCVSSSSLCALW